MWLEGTQLVPITTLPSGGDNSYPGFVALSGNRALVSYYSSHEKDDAGKPMTAIYTAELTSSSGQVADSSAISHSLSSSWNA